VSKNTEQRTYDLVDDIIQLNLESTRACALQGNIRAQKDLGIALMMFVLKQSLNYID